MKRSLTTLALSMIALAALTGAKSCGTVWAETNRKDYTVSETGTTMLNNETDESVYLPGCGTFNYEKSVNGQWQDMGPDVVCVWEGIARPVGSQISFGTYFSAQSPGTWRLRYAIGVGCTEGKPLSQANCSSHETVYTNEYTVTGNACPEL